MADYNALLATMYAWRFSNDARAHASTVMAVKQFTADTIKAFKVSNSCFFNQKANYLTNFYPYYNYRQYQVSVMSTMMTRFNYVLDKLEGDPSLRAVTVL